jgi:hypothetical protein
MDANDKPPWKGEWRPCFYGNEAQASIFLGNLWGSIEHNKNKRIDDGFHTQ